VQELTDLWWRLFVNRTDGTLRAGKRGWIFTRQELTPAEMERSLAGQQALGVYAVDEHGRSRWLCLDADTEEGRDYLIDLAQRFDPASSLFELSRRGAHLWLLCPGTTWQRVQTVGLALVEGGPAGIEVFPKGPGRNGVRVPLTCHPRTGERYPVVDPYTGEVRSLASLRMLHPAPLPKIAMRYERAIGPGRPQLARTSYEELFHEIQCWTRLREYGPERAIGRCPFHDDRNPSLSLLGGFWRCWAGCGQGGLYAFQRLLKERGLEVMRHEVSTTQ
jgi:hypothetical protein